MVAEKGILRLEGLAGGEDGADDYDDEEETPQLQRNRLSMALKGASQLYTSKAIDQRMRGVLKVGSFWRRLKRLTQR